MAPLTKRIAAVVGAVALAATLSSCSSGGALTQARAACKQVERSLTTYRQATASPRPSNANALIGQAQSQLLKGLGPASEATSSDGSFNALMTTISEATRVPEGYLVPSLSSQCKVIFSSTPYLSS